MARYVSSFSNHNGPTAACLACALLLLGLVPSHARAQDQVVSEIHDVYPRELYTDGFVLKKDQKIAIEAVGPATRRGRYGLSNAWILDTQKREVVWQFEDADVHERDRASREAVETITLPAGAYEVYYSTFPARYGQWNDDGWGNDYDWDTVTLSDIGYLIRDAFNELFDRNGRRYYEWDSYYRREAQDFGLKVRAGSDAYHEADTRQLFDAFASGAVVNLTGLQDDAYVRQGFTVSRPVDVEVYAVGEIRRDSEFDHGWIMNVETRERVWTMDYFTTREAGGGSKNRATFETLRLPAGRYAAFFATDDSHGPNAWNVAPPFDPDAWGMMLFPKNDSDRDAITLFEYQDVNAANAFVDLTRMRDDEYRRVGFRLPKDMDVHVYAIGEGRSGDMVDYGWILNADTRERVWTMDYNRTEHAGGGEKNRLFDGVVHLDAGNYVAYYVTDGSHDYGDWNVSPPYDRERYGLTLTPADDDVSASIVESYDYADMLTQNAIVSLTRMRDDDFASKGFSLSKPMDVRIYALGEGRGGDMFDYGWIVNAGTRQRVWEMEYYDTEHAGGGDKNRLFDGIIHLDAGNYEAYFVTDGSHSYEDWNDGAPFDPESWGLTVLPVRSEDRDAVGPYEESNDANVLARITRVRDNARERARFTLDHDGEVNVYALGEGSDGRMYDYAWIEDAGTGRVVWEMTYRMTDYAGGGDKNRLVDTVLPLKAGEYEVFYRSDGSHSFRDWNTAPPFDPEAWGVTIRAVEGR